MRDAAVRSLRSVIEGAPYASVQSQMAKALDFGLLRSRLARLYKARARPLTVHAVVVPLPGVLCHDDVVEQAATRKFIGGDAAARNVNTAMDAARKLVGSAQLNVMRLPLNAWVLPAPPRGCACAARADVCACVGQVRSERAARGVQHIPAHAAARRWRRERRSRARGRHGRVPAIRPSRGHVLPGASLCVLIVGWARVGFGMCGRECAWRGLRCRGAGVGLPWRALSCCRRRTRAALRSCETGSWSASISRARFYRTTSRRRRRRRGCGLLTARARSRRSRGS